MSYMQKLVECVSFAQKTVFVKCFCLYIFFSWREVRGGKVRKREERLEFAVHKEKSHCKFKRFLEKFIEP